MKPKTAYVLKAIEIDGKFLCLVHCTCGKYHVVHVKTNGKIIEIMDTAGNRKDGIKRYNKCARSKIRKK